MNYSDATLSAGRESRTDVLLVDDSVTDLQLLMDMMTLRGLRISVALDGIRGCQQALLLQPGLVLLDVCMPGMDGFAVCRRLKSSRLTQDIPVIFLTAANDLAQRLEGFAAGGVDYIGKPFESQEVLARVGVHLRRNAPVPVPEPARTVTPEPGLPGDGDDLTLVAAAQQAMREAIASPPGLESLARQLGTNRRRLNEAFQDLCGQPVFGWLREERLRESYTRVSQDRTTFSTISEQLGYATPANFTRAFRLRFGFTPRQVREQMQGISDADAL